MQADQGSRIVHVTISKDMVNAFYSYFKGRNDVYTLRAARPNKKTGKYGYYTQCWNFWKDGDKVKDYQPDKDEPDRSKTENKSR